MPDILPAKATELMAAQDASVVLQAEIEQLATHLGYEGALTVGTLEDEIRFFQRRTVEAILETGKRLLLLKKIVPHGEFEQRVELLGFADRTAQRFMSAAQKTSKSAKLALLSTQVKNASAFLELITHDDDVIKSLTEMDEFDRMSASQLRTAAREGRQELENEKKISGKKSERIQAQQDQIDRIAVLPADEDLADLQAKATKRMSRTLASITGELRQALIAVKNHGDEDHSLFMAGLVGQVQADLNALRDEFHLPDISTAAQQELAAEVAQWAKQS